MQTKLIIVILAALAIAAISRDAVHDPSFWALLARKQNATLAFSWSNCGATSDPSKISALNVSPSPIKLGSPVQISLTGYLSATVTAGGGYNADLQIYKSIFGAWIMIPCVDGLGSCTIPDICSKLTPNDNCPLKPYNIPCSCPLPSGNYNIPASNPATLNTQNPNISWLTDGDFKIQGTVYAPAGTRMACYQIIASLSS